jgi:hypothetical protein
MRPSGNASSPLVLLATATAAAGIFTRDGSGVGQALAFNADGTPNTAATPAALGENISIAVNGLGEWTPGVARHLLHPFLVGMPGNSGQADTPTLQVNEEQDVVCHQPTPGEHFDREEIDAGQHRQMRLNKVLPRRGLASLRRWRNPVALQNIPYGLIRDRIPKIGQRAHNAVVPPTRILFGHLYDQGFQFRFDSRPAGIATVLGAIELVGNQPAIPSQNGIGFGHGGDLGQGFAPESLADFSQHESFRIGRAQSGGQV